MIKQLAGDLHLKGIEVKILTFGEDDKKNRPYSVIKAKNKVDFFIKMLGLVKNIDIIYTFDLYTAGFFSRLLRGKRKLVVRFAGDSAWESAFNSGKTADDIKTFQNKYYGLKIGLLKKIRGWILKGAGRVVSVSQFLKEIAMLIGAKEEKIEVIYNSVDFVGSETTHRQDIRNKLGLNNNKVIVTAGRLVPWKGVDGLIAAIKKLISDFNDIKLLVVGDGPDRPRLEELVIKEGLTKEVIFSGRVNLNDIFDYYSAADVFVLNSKYEGLSHVLLEVLKSERPIIASNSGGNPEVIENEKNGLLVDYGNVDQLVVAIKRMLIEEKWSSPEYKDACRESLTKFNWTNNVDQTVKLLKEVSNE